MAAEAAQSARKAKQANRARREPGEKPPLKRGPEQAATAARVPEVIARRPPSK